MAQEFKTRRVVVTPKPGFVVKTTTTKPGYYTPSSTPPPSSTPLTLTQPSASTPTSVPPSLKTFINVAYSPSIPAPPTSSVFKMTAEQENEAIKRAMDGDENSLYFVPVVVSDGREDRDKAGKPSLVFDAILNSSLKARITKDVDFRSFVLEIILAHIESPPQSPNAPPTRSIVLSRTLGTPNIRSKGVLEPRSVEVPDFGQVPEDDNGRNGTAPAIQPRRRDTNIAEKEVPQKKTLIEEIPAAPSPAIAVQQPKSILKKQAPAAPLVPRTEPSPDILNPDPHVKTDADARLETPIWRWDQGDGRVRDLQHDKLIVETPKFTRPDHARSTLSLSPRVLTLRTPAYFLQLSLDKDVDVEAARAEWRVGESRVVVYV